MRKAIQKVRRKNYKVVYTYVYAIWSAILSYVINHKQGF